MPVPWSLHDVDQIIDYSAKNPWDLVRHIPRRLPVAHSFNAQAKRRDYLQEIYRCWIVDEGVSMMSGLSDS